MRSGRMGDFLVALPALAIVRRRWSGMPVVLLTALSSNPVIAQNAVNYAGVATPPWVELFRGSLFDEVIMVGNWKSLSGWWRLRRELSRFRFQEAFLLPYGGEKLLRRWQKCWWVRSLGVYGRVHAVGRVSEDPPRGISLQAWAPFRVVASALPDNITFPALPPIRLESSAENFADSFWREHGLEGQKVAAIFPAGTYAHKVWPSDRFSQLTVWLMARGVRVLLIGSDGERALSAQVAACLPDAKCLNLTGATTLAQLAAVLKRCALFVGNDGGPAHLAATLGVRCVTLMSGVHEEGAWDPLGVANIAVRFKTSCYGCRSEFSCPTGTHACIGGIEVTAVAAACERQLRANTEGHA
jgi:ADP-heptose:LPS heptosyltransferase